MAIYRERRTIRPPSRYQYVDYVSTQVESDHFNEERECYEESTTSKDFAKWLAAMQDEMSSLYIKKLGI